MDARKQQIADIFNGHRILSVPFYQRSYVWHKEQWKRFLEDMEFISYSNQDYFLGSVILKQRTTQTGETNDLRTIIDGQQRFTTLAIFAKVLCLKTDDDAIFAQHFTVRTSNRHSKAYALCHSLNDVSDFEFVLGQKEDKFIDDYPSSNIVNAYNYFQQNINVNRLNIDSLLAHISFIVIDLDQKDDEQAIFDTINSLGVRLTTAELLKNYFFAEEYQLQYEEMWKPVFEDNRDIINFWNSVITMGRTQKSNIEAFFYAFLNIKIQDSLLKILPEHKVIYRRTSSLFGNYKNLISTYHLNIQSLLEEIVDYAKSYLSNIRLDVLEKELPAEPCIDRINFIMILFDCSTALPYVLFVLHEVKDIHERNKIFGYLETYIVRRSICKSENNSFSDLFTEHLIGNRIISFEDLRDYIEEKEEENALAMPSDDVLRMSLFSFSYPNKKALAILYLLESILRSKESHATHLFPFCDYSLEHLMPQKYEKNWPLSGYTEEERIKRIKCMGNLAMLPIRLNSSISNADWITKKNGKKDYRGLKYLASDLVTLKNVLCYDEWNEDTIYERLDYIANEIIRVWPSYLGTANPTIIEDFSSTYKRVRKQHRDKTKYSLNRGAFTSKKDFILNLVRNYVITHPNLTYKQLKQVFHDDLCTPGHKMLGFLCTQHEFTDWNNFYKNKRYNLLDASGKIKPADNVIVYVNTQWTQTAVLNVLNIAKDEGWEVLTKDE